MLKKQITFSIKGLTAIIIALSLNSCAYPILHSSRVNGIPSTEIWQEKDSFSTESIPALIKKDNKDFKVLLLADIQIDSWDRKGRKHSFSLIKELIETQKPDLVVTLGDNTQGLFADKMATKLIKYMETFDIPWAATFGNHDSEGTKARAWHGNQYEAAPNSLFRYGPSNIHGVGNYPVLIKNEEGDIIYSLIMMDSNVTREYDSLGSGYDFIYKDQIDWYKWQIKGVSKSQFGEFNPSAGKVVPSMCFFHIPLLEFDDAVKAIANGTIDTSDVVGENKEGVASAKVNTGLFSTMKELESTTHVFCGHDHVNNMSVNWKGIQLSYGLKTGKTSYFDEKMQGGTLLTITTNDKTKPAQVEIDYIFINK